MDLFWVILYSWWNAWGSMSCPHYPSNLQHEALLNCYACMLCLALVITFASDIERAQKEIAHNTSTNSALKRDHVKKVHWN